MLTDPADEYTLPNGHHASLGTFYVQLSREALASRGIESERHLPDAESKSDPRGTCRTLNRIREALAGRGIESKRLWKTVWLLPPDDALAHIAVDSGT